MLSWLLLTKPLSYLSGFCLIASVVDFALSREQKEIVDNILLALWNHVDSLLRLSWIRLLRRRKSKAILIFASCFPIAIFVSYAWDNREYSTPYESIFFPVFIGSGVLVGVVGALVMYHVSLKFDRLWVALLVASAFLVLSLLPERGFEYYAATHAEALTPKNNQITILIGLWLIGWVWSLFFAVFSFIFWLALALPILVFIFSYILLLTIELLLRRVLEGGKGFIVALGLGAAALLSFLKG